MNILTLGKNNNGYVNVDLDTLSIFCGENYNLDTKKYVEGKKKSKVIYTVVGLVSNSFEYKSFEGYIIADDKGQISLVKEDKLISLLKKYHFMNYSLATTANGYYSRRNPKVEVREYLDDNVALLLGYSFKDFSLSFNMTLEQLDFCMKNNGFILGFKNVFPLEYFGKQKRGLHLVYYNKEGTQIVLNYVDDIDRPLNYYGQTCLMIRDIDYKKYHNYIRENPYIGGSSSPLEDLRGVKEEPTHGKMLFTFTNLSHFLTVSVKAKSYSKGVNPYVLGSDSYGIHSVLSISPYQERKIKEYCESKGLDYKHSLFLKLYRGYLNVLQYDDGLKKFYKSILNSMPKYFETYGEVFNISNVYLFEMKKFVENLI